MVKTEKKQKSQKDTNPPQEIIDFLMYLRKTSDKDYRGCLSKGAKPYPGGWKIAGNTEFTFLITTKTNGCIRIFIRGDASKEGLTEKMEGVKKKMVTSFDGGQVKVDPPRKTTIIGITFLQIKLEDLKGDTTDNTKKELMKKLLLELLDALGRPKDKRRGKNHSDNQDTHDFDYNLIIFGAPGTGKSHYLEDLRTHYGIEQNESVENYQYYPHGVPNAVFPLFEENNYERVTFYPTYSYAQFVGSYKPVMRDVDEKGFELPPKAQNAHIRKAIAYEFVPGPFLRILKKALRNKDKKYLLIIEEINRANAAAVFGDVFQLLDRKDDEDEDEGESKYSITPSKEIFDYLTRKDEDGKGISEGEAKALRIPSNMYIWATMNSADQGVFPLDTAFKRRWNFIYRSLDDNQANVDAIVEIGKDCQCKWGDLRKVINCILKRAGVNEDKLLSSSFVNPDGDKIISSNRFKMKVLMYLWEDATRMCRNKVFADESWTFSELMRAWDKVQYVSEKDDLMKDIFKFSTEKKEERLILENRGKKDNTPGDIEADSVEKDRPVPSVIRADASEDNLSSVVGTNQPNIIDVTAGGNNDNTESGSGVIGDEKSGNQN
ncbi:MAG: AAA family ATPase [Kiritimatiellae bacterium]|nr:AAA family ATPase [Kiritimatiellia bacterium]